MATSKTRKKAASTSSKKITAKKKKPSPKVHWQAEGYRSINPFLTVKNPAAALSFYKKAFGFEKKYVMPGPDNTIQHAEMLYNGETIMMGGESAEMNMYAPSYYKGTSLTLYLYSQDVDALCKKAKKAGAVCLMEPKDMYWGDRVCILTDPDGYVWWFASHVEDISPEDTHP